MNSDVLPKSRTVAVDRYFYEYVNRPDIECCADDDMCDALSALDDLFYYQIFDRTESHYRPVASARDADTAGKIVEALNAR
jgi:hypothetical protein